MKNQFRIENLPFPLSIDEAASKDYVDGAIILGVNESLLLRLHPDTAIKVFELNEQDSILLDSTITTPRTSLELPTKNYVDNKFNDPSIINQSISINNNCTNNDNIIEILMPLITIIPCALSLICLIYLMAYTLIKLLINKKQLININGENFISESSS